MKECRAWRGSGGAAAGTTLWRQRFSTAGAGRLGRLAWVRSDHKRPCWPIQGGEEQKEALELVL